MTRLPSGDAHRTSRPGQQRRTVSALTPSRAAAWLIGRFHEADTTGACRKSPNSAQIPRKLLTKCVPAASSALSKLHRATCGKVVTVSDAVAAGTREDRSGPAVAAVLTEAGFSVTEHVTVRWLEHSARPRAPGGWVCG